MSGSQALRSGAQEESSVSCSGLAPLTVWCRGGGQFEVEDDGDDQASFELVFSPGENFFGVIENDGGTKNGTWEADCFVPLPGFEPDCEIQVQGTFVEGTFYSFTGRSDRLSAGYWATGVANG